MKKVHFLFGIHNNQPIGNFDHVFRKAFSDAYKPFISLLHRFPTIKTNLHFSGTLLEWLDAEEPQFIESIQALTARRQVEILSGGMYEPVFSVLRERDVQGQVGMMNAYIQNRLKTSPRGAWIAERVWDPVLPRLLSNSGLAYTLLDSTHFLHAGLSPEQIHGYYITEREGQTLSVFPIDMYLRYTIPFYAPEKTIEYLSYLASDEKDVAVTYGDDGEKFGVWPGTYSWVYEHGWLEAFFKELEKNRHMIKTATFSEYLDEHPPEGLIYLPTLTYNEMMEWALPADSLIRYEDMKKHLQRSELLERYGAFITGGYWNNFMAKYPESNTMHKKMLLVSERLEEAQGGLDVASPDEALERARRSLYKGQCNCAYWHGLFGGIYLNSLRHAVYQNLLQAECLIDTVSNGDLPWMDYLLADFKRDQSEDILVSGKNLNAYFSPRDGGGMFELDYKPCFFNLANTFTRHMEAYHRKLRRGESINGTLPLNGNHTPLFQKTAEKEAVQPGRLTYDWYQRHSFIDHFLGAGTTIENFSTSCFPEAGNFIHAPYILDYITKAPDGENVSFRLSRHGHVLEDDQQQPILVTKSFTLHDARMTVDAAYTVTNNSPRELSLCFAVECNVSLLAGADPLRHYTVSGSREKTLMNSTRSFSGITSVVLSDCWNGFSLTFSLEPPADMWAFPIETLSQSEDGLEKMYQGTSYLFRWNLVIPRGQTVKRDIGLSFCALDVCGED